jgi:AraC-like DNA-binding protein
MSSGAIIWAAAGPQMKHAAAAARAAPDFGMSFLLRWLVSLETGSRADGPVKFRRRLCRIAVSFDFLRKSDRTEPVLKPRRLLAMPDHVLDRLVTTLDVRLHAFAVCEIQSGARLNFDAMNVVVVHYVLSGEGVLTAKNASPVPFKAGALLIVPPNLSQSLTAGGIAERDVNAAENCSLLEDGLLLFDAAAGKPGDLRVICGTITASFGSSFGVFDLIRAPVVDSLTDASAVRAAYELLIAERAHPDYGTRALTEALMKQCLILLIRRQLKQGGALAQLFALSHDTRLAGVVHDILTRPAASHSLAELARVAGMSRSAFAKTFSETFGETPMDFVLRTRLHHAAELLRITDLPVKAIAASTGFASRSHFSRAFKAAFGADPSAYRSERSAARTHATYSNWFARMFVDSN